MLALEIRTLYLEPSYLQGENILRPGENYNRQKVLPKGLRTPEQDHSDINPMVHERYYTATSDGIMDRIGK